MRHVCAAIFAALFFFLTGVTAALAQDITLRSRDGGVELTGTLLGFDGEFYRLKTQYGELTVDSSGVLCEGVGCPSLTDFVAELTISGSSTIGTVLMPALIEAFALRSGLSAKRETTGPDSFIYQLTDTDTGKTTGRFFFHLTNTDTGFADLLADEADMVMAMREIRPLELEQARAAGLGDMKKPGRSRVLALDAMVPVVAANNPVDAISPSDLSKLLRGDVRNWQALGGPDAPVTLHMRDAKSGLAQGVEDRLLKENGTPRGETQRHDTNARLAEAVADDPFGLGIASYSEIGNTKPLVLTGPCGFSLSAARRTIKTEDFPLTAPMFLYLPARRLPALGREFLAFSQSNAAQIVIRRAGFVDQAPEEVPIDLQGDRLRNAVVVANGEEGLTQLQRMAGTLSGMKRLTLSFRFEAGSSRLDAQSRSNVQLLARALESGTYDGRRMMFVGFSDGQGPAEGNLRIAQKRAKTVQRAVLEAAETADLDQVDISNNAFGEAMPMACDDSSWGRQVNRRVEVWLE
ncbi:phosphate ABC transporter substrate-binding/OmpA family protein [Pacificoceanicola onchidii]|uniref:phosphate ABC transporter substrate-binding/OmpA family protein n=1 Tax=Pacificoceanicola onchidii TaxID=2562685 RepID=UPI0010A4BB0A|nr:phosphate ABC transporter substrate-binding/OmpA family protein [Pacificoceanicola onchidii]